MKYRVGLGPRQVKVRVSRVQVSKVRVSRVWVIGGGLRFRVIGVGLRFRLVGIRLRFWAMRGWVGSTAVPFVPRGSAS